MHITGFCFTPIAVRHGVALASRGCFLSRAGIRRRLVPAVSNTNNGGGRVTRQRQHQSNGMAPSRIRVSDAG